MKTKEELLTQFETSFETLFDENEFEELLNFVNTYNWHFPIVAKIYFNKESQKFKIRYLTKNECPKNNNLVYVVTIHGMANNYISYRDLLNYLYELMKCPIEAYDIFG